MASSDTSIVFRCAVLLTVSVAMVAAGSVLTKRLPGVRGEYQPAVSRGVDESLLLDVADARCEVQRSLDHLDDILHHVTEERKTAHRALDKLEAIEERLRVSSDETRCSSNPCQNGGTCTEEPNGYKCICPLGYSGALCQIMSSDETRCSGNPCQNGGTCAEEPNGYKCICPLGYSGALCQIKTSPCSSNPCQNGATCLHLNNFFVCACVAGYTGVHCELQHSDCSDWKRARPGSISGLYTVFLNDTWSARVYCDMDTDRGGWTVFQRRVNGRVSFYRDWADYSAGFGELDSEFWMGNRLIHAMTERRNYRLRVDLTDFENNTRAAEYDLFSVSSEQDGFRLNLGTYNGTAGDALGYHDNAKFSTRDVDNDGRSGSCAQSLKAGWWYVSCHESNLNGLYLHGIHASSYKGVNWKQWKGVQYSLKTTSMSIRPVDF